MNKTNSFLCSFFACFLLIHTGSFAADIPQASQQETFKRIEELTGAKGAYDEKEQVFKVSFPRKDLEVNAAGAKITPPMGLTAWAAFKLMGDHTMMMGDMVMTEDQVNPVMSVALENGLEVTALHNHFFWDSPKIMFMHIGGMRDTEALAQAVGKVFEKIRETSGGKGEKPYLEIDPSKTSLDPKNIEEIMGKTGKMNDGVYKITIGRTTQMGGHEMGNAMGVNTWAAFIGSDEKALVDGDFAMLESEVQPVLKALRGAGINIVAIHNHMTMENPRIIFLHYWGIGATVDLAKALKAALDLQKQ
ncbi:MAG TPA: DUF1259 domain-containing protein [Verrucomicrobiae bacterium]|jgi:hypothetical protein|nr:DUF1259 domain-containing protein [Verrucomicrobiae bacterium]